MNPAQRLLPALVLTVVVSVTVGLKAVQRPDRGAAEASLAGPVVPLTAGNRVIIGPAITTPYGLVQVRVHVRAGRLLEASAVKLPDQDELSTQLSRVAAPQLQRESLTSQASRVDTVSGATWTSEGYRRSLQAALDTLRAQTPGG